MNKTLLRRVITGCLGLGLGSTIIFFILLTLVLDIERASSFVFGHSFAVLVLFLGALWYPFVKKHLH